MEEDSNLKVNSFIPEIDNQFKANELYSSFGMIHLNKEEYSFASAFIVSTSEDIEISKVIDFLKDFIPSQFEEVSSLKILDRFKAINKKIAEVLGDTLGENSFIDVSIAHIITKNSKYLYVSLDEGYDIQISRGEKIFHLRKQEQETIDGSGIIYSNDLLNLTFQNVNILSWQKYAENLSFAHEPIIMNEIPTVSDDNNSELSNISINTLDEDDSDDIQANNVTSNKLTKISNFKSTLKPKLNNIAKDLGDFFSYLLSFITRKGNKRLPRGNYLPNKKKGFLIVVSFIFLVVLLGLFIKNTNEQNIKKQNEDKYKQQVASVSNDIKQVEAQSASVSIGDKTLEAQIANLKNEVNNISSSPLKNSLSLGDEINGFGKDIATLQDRVDGTIRVDQASVLSRFQGFLTNPNPSSLAMKNNRLFMTDLNNSKLIEVNTTSGDLKDFLTSSDGIAKPQSIIDDKNSLLLLDTQNGIYSINIDTKQIKKLPGYDSISPTSTVIKTYYDATTNNFYLLQPSKNQIYRVPGVGNEVFALAGKYNTDPLPSNISDFSIIGGSSYVVDNTGNINKYTRSSNGVTQDSFSMPQMDIPIGADAKIAGMTPREQGSVYLFVADPTNNRILVFDNKDANGNIKYVAQFEPQSGSSYDFKSIKSILVDESAGAPVLYAMSSYGIFKINVEIK